MVVIKNERETQIINLFQREVSKIRVFSREELEKCVNLGVDVQWGKGGPWPPALGKKKGIENNLNFKAVEASM